MNEAEFRAQDHTLQYTEIFAGLKLLGVPRYHGNGFTQLYLNPETRLHVWHKALKPLRDHNAMVHNHRYDVRSTVYSGRLIHTTYDLLESGVHDVRVIQLDGASDAFKTPEIETGQTARLSVRHRYEFTRGATYTMANPHFHTSEHGSDEAIITIFERFNKRPEWAQVLCGIHDAQATHAFAPETQPPEGVLWNALQDALRRCDNPDLFYRLKGYIQKHVVKFTDVSENITPTPFQRSAAVKAFEAAGFSGRLLHEAVPQPDGRFLHKWTVRI